MAKKSVFVSFDFDNDKRYKYLLEAWDANPKFDFLFADKTPDEIDSSNIGRIKAALSARIATATYTLVIVGKEANKLHRHWRLIGYTNWINFEIAKSKESGNRLVAVKIDRSYESPEELVNAGASWAMSFDQAPIIRALEQA
jgi:hypothetical protein